MSSTEPIEGFLQAQEAEGHHDSRGQFTIAAEEAWRKLGRSQLPPLPEAWILPVVQAANRAGCARMNVRLGRSLTRVLLQGGWRWSFAELEAALLGAPVADSPLQSLAVALRALLTGPRASTVCLITPMGEQLSWDGERLIVSPDSTSPGEQTSLTVAHSAGGRRLPGFGRSEDAAVIAGLQSTLAVYAVASAVPVWCDRRLISGLERSVEQPGRRILAYLPVWRDDLPAFSFPVPSRWRPLKWSDETSFALSSPQAEVSGISAAVAVLSVAVSQRESTGGALELAQTRKSCLLWVRDGVIVGSKALPLSGALDLRIFASAQGLPTDLSDLNLRQDKALLQRQRSVGTLVANVVQRLRDEGDGDAFRVEGLTSRFMPLLAAGVVVTSIFNPLGAMALAGLGSMTALGWRNSQHGATGRMDLQLERELNILPRKLRTALDTRD